MSEGNAGSFGAGMRAAVASPVVSQPVTTASGLPVLSDKGDPSENYAQVSMALWNDFQKNFAPFQYRMLEGMTTENPGLVAEDVGLAKEQVTRAFDVSRQNRQVSMERFGMAPDAQTQKSMDRQDGLDKATSLVGAANTTRARLKQRDMELMTTGVPNVAGRSYGMAGG